MLRTLREYMHNKNAVWGVTAPFWFAFAGSAIILALIWRSLLNIAHTDENLRAHAPART